MLDSPLNLFSYSNLLPNILIRLYRLERTTKVTKNDPKYLLILLNADPSQFKRG